jgi:hypothetical protein
MRATCLGEDACSPSTCLGSQFPPSWSFSLNVPTSTSIETAAICDRWALVAMCTYQNRIRRPYRWKPVEPGGDVR